MRWRGEKVVGNDHKEPQTGLATFLHKNHTEKERLALLPWNHCGFRRVFIEFVCIYLLLLFIVLFMIDLRLDLVYLRTKLR